MQYIRLEAETLVTVKSPRTQAIFCGQVVAGRDNKRKIRESSECNETGNPQ